MGDALQRFTANGCAMLNLPRTEKSKHAQKGVPVFIESLLEIGQGDGSSYVEFLRASLECTQLRDTLSGMSWGSG